MASTELTTPPARRAYAKAFMRDFRGNIPNKQERIIRDIQAFAASLRWECDITLYQDTLSKITFVCEHGHTFATSRKALRKGQWCPRCSDDAQILKSMQTLASMHKFAISRGGLCLADFFRTTKHPIRWQCAQGHIWVARPDYVVKQNGTWCPVCGLKERAKKHRRYTISDMQAWAAIRGGKCLSEYFESVEKPLQWQCAQGHIWTTRPHNVIKEGGTWCPVCSLANHGANSRKYTLEDMQQWAAQHGGAVLSESFTSVRKPLSWQCAQGHIWTAKPAGIVKEGGSWCPRCAKNAPKSIEDMRALAAARGGYCLSQSYDRANKKLHWRCAAEHEFAQTPNDVQQGSWCPVCKTGLGERICRAFFEQLFNTIFPKMRPSWLRTSDGRRLELDGYSTMLAIAFEHQGLQHYGGVPLFHRTPQRLERLQSNDQRKRDLCKAHNILLIEIPSVLDMRNINEIREHIHYALLKNNLIVPKKLFTKEIDLSNTYSPQLIRDLQIIAQQHGGRLISTAYLGAETKLEWECSEKHIFMARPAHIKNRHTWCPRCCGKNKTIDDMHTLAHARNGQCLSEKYIDRKTALLWQCQYGHQWHTTPDGVIQGAWCPVCANKQRWITRRSRKD